MSDVIKKLQEQRLRTWAAATALADKAADENRAFTAEEESQWTTMNTELDALDRRGAALLEGEKRAKEAEESYNQLSGKATRDGAPSSANQDELRTFLAGGRGASREYLLTPQGNVPSLRDLTKLTSAAGGATVPTTFYNRLMAHMIEVSGILQAGPTVLNTASGETITVPKTLTYSTGGIIAEAASITESDPTFGNASLGAFKYARLIQVSRELLADTGVDLEAFLAQQVGRALGNAFGEDLVTGTGTNEPRGIVTDATLGVTTAVGDSTGFGSQNVVDKGFDYLISLYHSVISPYRASASCGWLMSDATAAKVRKLKNSDGVYAWQPSVVVGAPDTILGKPVHIDPNVAAPAANAKSILFGDFSQYFVRTVNGIRFERSDDFAFGNDLVTFRAVLRGDGALVDLTGAVKYLQHAAT